MTDFGRMQIGRYDRENIIGLPKDHDNFLVVTNSTLGRWECASKGLYSAVNNFKRESGWAANEGNCWHGLMESVFEWWAETGNKPYEPEFIFTRIDPDTGLSDLEKAMAPMWADVEKGIADHKDVADFEESLKGLFYGWITRHNGLPPNGYEVVGVELEVARQVFGPDGEPFTPTVFLVPNEDGGWRIAREGEASHADAKSVKWPVYFIGKMDGLLRNVRQNTLLALDHKATSRMSQYIGTADMKPQLARYSWILKSLLDHFQADDVEGFWFEVVSRRRLGWPSELKWKPPGAAELKEMAAKKGIATKAPPVKELRAIAEERGIDVKGMKAAEMRDALDMNPPSTEELLALLGIEEGHGGFSKSESKTSNVPSWRWEQAIAKAGLERSEYEDIIAYVREVVDPSFYESCPVIFGPAMLTRAEAELYGKVRLHFVNLYLAAKMESETERWWRFPRTPVCLGAGSGCSFKNPCSMGTNPVREDGMKQVAPVTWGAPAQAGEIKETAEEYGEISEFGF